MSEPILAWLAIAGGLALLVAGGELLVRGASKLAAAVRISPLVIGLTVVAFGTSAPELAVSIQAALTGRADLAVGNVVGSNIFNVLFILGISAMIVPLVVGSQLIRRDVPLMIGSSLLLLVFSLNGQISRLEGFLLFCAVVVYTGWVVWQSRRESKEVKAEFAQEWAPANAQAWSPTKTTFWQMMLQLAFIVAGLVLLGVGSRLLVNGAVSVALRWGVSEVVIGLTIVAAGTSLPEVVTSIVAAIRGEREIAVGNIVGSNIFNILSVLGMSSLIAPHGVVVSSSILQFDLPVMIVVAVACLPVFITGNVIARWEGALFFFYYLVYTADLVLNATSNQMGHTLRDVMAKYVLPLTLITLAVSLWRSFRRDPSSAAASEENDQSVTHA